MHTSFINIPNPIVVLHSCKSAIKNYEVDYKLKDVAWFKFMLFTMQTMPQVTFLMNLGINYLVKPSLNK